MPLADAALIPNPEILKAHAVDVAAEWGAAYMPDQNIDAGNALRVFARTRRIKSEEHRALLMSEAEKSITAGIAHDQCGRAYAAHESIRCGVILRAWCLVAPIQPQPLGGYSV